MCVLYMHIMAIKCTADTLECLNKYNCRNIFYETCKYFGHFGYISYFLLLKFCFYNDTSKVLHGQWSPYKYMPQFKISFCSIQPCANLLCIIRLSVQSLKKYIHIHSIQICIYVQQILITMFSITLEP